MKPRIANICSISQIKDCFNTEMKIGFLDEDFIRNLHTVQFKIKFKHLAYIYRIKVSDEVEDSSFIQAIKDKAEDEVSHKIWRLNDKRTRHGLESWV